MTWIDSKEAAKLMCITLQAVDNAAREGKYEDKVRYIKGRGGSGKILQVALEALPEEAQIKWQSDKENIYRGRQLEEEIGTNDFITPVLKPVINESIKKSKTVVSNSNKIHSGK